MISDDDDILSSMRELDSLDKASSATPKKGRKKRGSGEAVINATVAPASDEVSEEALINEQAILSTGESLIPAPIMLVLPGVVWHVEAGEKGEPKISSFDFTCRFGITENEALSNYHWPEFDIQGLGAYATYRSGSSKCSVVEGWSARLAVGALLFAIKTRGDRDGLVRIALPGCEADLQSICEAINQLSSSDRVASFYPRLARSSNGAPERIVTEVAKFYSGEVAFLHSDYAACMRLGEGAFYSSSATIEYSELINLSKMALVGQRACFNLANAITDSQIQRLSELAENKGYIIVAENQQIQIIPTHSIHAWLVDAWKLSRENEHA